MCSAVREHVHMQANKYEHGFLAQSQFPHQGPQWVLSSIVF